MIESALKQFDQKVVLITGGNSGIGRACAEQFAQAGARVIIMARRQQLAEVVIKAIQKVGGHCDYIACDLTKSDQIARLFETLKQRYHRLDISINNAGVSGSSNTPLHELSQAVWDQVITVNMSATWQCMKAEIALLLAHQGGAIVNVASVGGLRAGRVNAAYTASKHGVVVGLTKAAAKKYAAKAIRVNAICPAFIDTPMLRELPEIAAMAADTIPMQRCGTEIEVANTIYHCMALFIKRV